MTEIYLNTSVYDNSEMREYLAYKIYNAMGIDTQSYLLTDLKINGNENGIVTIVEVINENYIAQKYANNQGNLYKPTLIEWKGNLGADLRYYGEDLKEYEGIFNNVKTDSTTEEDKYRLIKIIKSINEANSKQELEQNFMDFDKIIKMIAINKAIANIDSFTSKTLRNYYLYEQDSKIDIIPFDFDLTMGSNPNKNFWTEEFDTYELAKGDDEIYSKLIEIILKDNEYEERYKKYYFDTLQKIEDMKIDNIIDDINSKIDEKVKLNTNKIYSYEEYKNGLNDLKKFMSNLLKSNLNNDLK